MKNRIISVLDASKYTYESIDYSNMYIADWSQHTNKVRGVEITDNSPLIDSVFIDNNSQNIKCDFFGFKDNALVIKPGIHSPQCECVLFPENTPENWVLCVETKYAKTGDEFKTFKDDWTYPFGMVTQIIETVNYFRSKNILPVDKLVSAIVSFPKLVDDFNSQFFAVIESQNPDLSITNIRLNHKIRIKATNMAIVKSEKRITL